MENQLYVPELGHERAVERGGGGSGERDVRPLGTADLVIAAEHTTIRREDPSENGVNPLFAAEEAQNLRSRWEKIQIGFVDEPRESVEQADQLVATVIKRLAEVFADERNKLEREWGKGDYVSTEDLRIALRRYRSFFDRLLSV